MPHSHGPQVLLALPGLLPVLAAPLTPLPLNIPTSNAFPPIPTSSLPFVPFPTSSSLST